MQNIHVRQCWALAGPYGPRDFTCTFLSLWSKNFLYSKDNYHRKTFFQINILTSTPRVRVFERKRQSIVDSSHIYFGRIHIIPVTLLTKEFIHKVFNLSYKLQCFTRISTTEKCGIWTHVKIRYFYMWNYWYLIVWEHFNHFSFFYILNKIPEIFNICIYFLLYFVELRVYTGVF